MNIRKGNHQLVITEIYEGKGKLYFYVELDEKLNLDSKGFISQATLEKIYNIIKEEK